MNHCFYLFYMLLPILLILLLWSHLIKNLLSLLIPVWNNLRITDSLILESRDSLRMF